MAGRPERTSGLRTLSLATRAWKRPLETPNLKTGNTSRAVISGREKLIGLAHFLNGKKTEKWQEAQRWRGADRETCRSGPLVRSYSDLGNYVHLEKPIETSGNYESNAPEFSISARRALPVRSGNRSFLCDFWHRSALERSKRCHLLARRDSLCDSSPCS